MCGRNLKSEIKNKKKEGFPVASYTLGLTKRCCMYVCACVCVCGVCAWCPVGYIPVLLRTLSENQFKPQSKLSPLFMLDDSI